MNRIILAIAAPLALIACTANVSSGKKAETPAVFEKNAATLTEPSVAVADAGEGLQWAAGVTDVVYLKEGDAKLFSTAGGDPAINGIYTYIAVYQSAADGWKSFQIGDFNEWKLVSEEPGRVVLEISRSVVDQPSGDIITASQRIAVTVPKADDTEVRVTPAD